MLERLSLWTLQCEEKKDRAIKHAWHGGKISYKKEEIEAIFRWVDLISDNKMK